MYSVMEQTVSISTEITAMSTIDMICVFTLYNATEIPD